MFDGIYYTLTDNCDHPAFKLLEHPKIVQPTQHHWLSLETKVVKQVLHISLSLWHKTLNIQVLREFTCSQTQKLNQKSCKYLSQMIDLNCTVEEYYFGLGNGKLSFKEFPFACKLEKLALFQFPHLHQKPKRLVVLKISKTYSRVLAIGVTQDNVYHYVMRNTQHLLTQWLH